MTNVLYMAKSPLAGVCEKMARVVNTYCSPRYQARVCNSGPGKHRWYCRGNKRLVPRYSIKDPEQVRECVEWADVIHCMANVGVRSGHFSMFDHSKILKSKRWVFQWHGAQIWPFERVWYPEDYLHVKFIHIGQGWIQTQPRFFGPFAERWGMVEVPNVITGDDSLHQPRPWEERKNKVGFAPSQRRETAVNRKGVKATTDALRGIQYDLICGAPFEVCLSRKSKCRLGIDEVVTPMYHLSGLEFLSQGTACICSSTQETRDSLMRSTGASRFPFINANSGTLRNVVLDYWGMSDDAIREHCRRAREWFDEFYHPRKVIERHIDVYE